jgi:hypothetical protein
VGGGGVRGAGLFLDERSGYLGGFRAGCEASGVVGLCEGVLSRFGRGV